MKKIHTCKICQGTPKDKHVWRIRVLDKMGVCDLCLDEVVAQASSPLLSKYLQHGEIIYEDRAKEIKWFAEVASSFGIVDEFQIYEEKILRREIVVQKTEKRKLLTPKLIDKHLKKFVIGQSHAKKTIAVATYNHFKRIKTGSAKKSNILMLGPTGVGKTYMVTLLSKLLELPFVIADANAVTAAGYVGGDVTDILASLFMKAGNNLELAQKGIVLIDEIDKIASRPDAQNRDIGGRAVQEALLKLIEGGEFKVEVGNGMMKESIMFDTTNVLFIVSGAFTGLDEIVKGRTTDGSRDWFGGEKITEDLSKDEAYKQITTEDLAKFGLIPELLGRLPIRTVLHPLSTDNLIAVMKDTEDSIVEYYTNTLKEDGVALTVTKSALKLIAEHANMMGTGARGLQTVFEELLLDIMYTAPSSKKNKKFSITAKLVKEILNKNKEK